jgi:4-alpha-glucanotransferase
MRTCGVLLPISSLPSPYGIGTLGKASYDWIDFLVKANCSYWQVLPIGPTSFKDSPYQTFSAFAGNPYFIDLDILIEEGLLSKDECVSSSRKNAQDASRVDYGWLYETRFCLFRHAFERFIEQSKKKEELTSFLTQHPWVKDYALFMSLKKEFQDSAWSNWPKEFKLRDEEVINQYVQKNTNEILFWSFLQYQFCKQWQNLLNYAHLHKIEIIGDLPIYVALDSADVWMNPKNFQLDENLVPKKVAGCPPDAFAPKGQLWGNPIYDYTHQEKNHFDWWIQRIEQSFTFFDVIRIDHFRGFEAYYTIPYGDKDAVQGVWEKGPGMKLFQTVKEKLGNVRIIAENLGFLTPEVQQLLEDTGFPGMKVLEFAMDPYGDSVYLPHNYVSNSVVYTGTHDNEPLASWKDTLRWDELDFCRNYFEIRNDDDFVDKMIRAALKSVSDLCIIPLQDWLGYGHFARMNTPSTEENNWSWRFTKEVDLEKLAVRMSQEIHLYRRENHR